MFGGCSEDHEVQGVIHLGVLGFYSVNQPHKLP